MHEVGAPDSNRSSLLRTDHLDMRNVARVLRYRSLLLQLSSQKMTDMPLDEANAVWPLVELTQQTGHAGTEADPFLFSGERSQMGVLFMETIFPLPCCTDAGKVVCQLDSHKLIKDPHHANAELSSLWETLPKSVCDDSSKTLHVAVGFDLTAGHMHQSPYIKHYLLILV